MGDLQFSKPAGEPVEKGPCVQTRTDSETILHGYEEYGKEILQKLRGMFAFVIWDKEKKELFGARDIFGIKPSTTTKTGTSSLWAQRSRAFSPIPAL